MKKWKRKREKRKKKREKRKRKRKGGKREREKRIYIQDFLIYLKEDQEELVRQSKCQQTHLEIQRSKKKENELELM